ncbi:hypothetical protein [Nocardia mikamii]|uniref:hypothetical protein n=1 Tax=Nocardia mikamii TaxID=508464 RepID=UPI000A00BA53|nr:hypothetical protein [Nocardia mikamii]
MGIEPGQSVVDDVGGRVELDQPVAHLHEPMYRLLATDPPQPHLVDEPLTFDRNFRDDRVHSAPVPFQLVSQSVSGESRNHPAIRPSQRWMARHGRDGTVRVPWPIDANRTVRQLTSVSGDGGTESLGDERNSVPPTSIE